MTFHISDSLFSELNDLIATRMGLSFPSGRESDLERGVCSAAREFGYRDVEMCIRWLLSSRLTRSQIETLAIHLTVGETYFFRENKAFEALEQIILPESIQRSKKSRQLRIWSAGCASGEEPYSIAMLLSQTLPDLGDWNITILATDVNHRALNKAHIGIYNRWSFRDCPQRVKQKYFERTEDGDFEICPDIKRMVTFGYHNLAEDPYPSLLNNTNAMDIIFCRNVLMYFVPDKQATAIQNFYLCLTDGGWLIVSPSECSHALYPQFVAVPDGNVPLYRKDSQSHRLTEALQTARAPSTVPIEGTTASPRRYRERRRESHGRSRPAVTSALEEEPRDRAGSKPTREQEAGALYEQNRYVEAEEAALALLSRNQTDPEATALLAKICANQGRLSEALIWCQKVISINKLNPSYHYLLATILQEQGQSEGAVSSLKHALFLDPTFALAHVALGNLARRQHKSRESRRHFMNALSLLSTHRPEDVLPQADGMTAGRLIEVINSTAYMEKLP